MSQADEHAKELTWTGERYVPFVGGETELEHLHRYALARDLAGQKDVLDIACGEGYGSYLLAGSARTVIGVDLSEEAIRHAQAKYVARGLEFRHGDCTRIPLKNNSVDMVVSFETIEHHDQHDAMLAEIKRVLRPDGVLLISTPERILINELFPLRNEFHVKELSLPEFTELLARYFKNHELFSQRVRYGSLIMPMASGAGDNKFPLHTGGPASITNHFADPEPLFLVALASEGDLSLPGASFFDGTDFIHRQRSSWQEDREALVKEIERVKTTVSWRITKPLRLVWNRLSRLLPRAHHDQ